MDDNNPIFGEDGIVPSGRSAGNNPLFIGGGEIARLMRAIDWSKTALGPIEGWSQALKSAISIMLPSKAQICLFWGPAFTILYNDAYSRIMGRKHPRVLATPGWVVWQEIWEDTLAPLLNQVVQTGASFGGQDYPFFLERSGFLEETYFDISYDPIRDETGAVGGVFCIVSDQSRRVISERRLAVLRLLAQHSSQKTIEAACTTAVEALAGAPRDVPFALLYLIEDGMPQLIARSGISTEERAAALLPVLDQALIDGEISLINNLERYFEVVPAGVWEGDPPRQAAVLPIRLQSQTETVGVLVCGVSPRLAYDEDYAGFLALVVGHIAASITNAQAYAHERRRAEVLAELDRVRNEFFANVSHEFRTPLTLILNPLQDLIQSGTLDRVQEEAIHLAHLNGLRLLKLVNTLLDFSQTQAERSGATFSPTDLAQFTADLASSFRSMSEQAGLKLVIDCPPLPEPIYVDREMWEKIVLNLLSNAFKFTFEGEIHIRVRFVDESVIMQVQDTGIGIAANDLTQIFERFHRVRGSRSRTHEGTGIGLALVQELVRLHGGMVDVESTPEVGTTFTVTLPRGSAHLPPDRVQPAGATSLIPSPTQLYSMYTEEAARWLPALPRPPKISPLQTGSHLLIVDDNADMRDYLRRVLEGRFRVSVANDGIAALEFIAQEMPDMVIADVMMPRLDGFGLIERLRADTRTQALPIMLLTAREGTQARVEGLRYGADDYLIKPFSVGELRARVESALNLARLRARLLDQEQDTRRQVERILESITDAFYALDFDWQITYANQAMARDIGITVSDLIGKNLWEVFPLSVGSPVWEALHRVMHEREPLTFETIHYRGNNWLEVSAHPTDTGISVYYRDISARIRAERRVRHLQEVTAALTGATTLDQIADIIIERALEVLDTDRGTIGLVSEDGQHIELLRQTDVAPIAKAWLRIPIRSGSGVLSDVLLSGEPILFSEQQEYVDAYPHLEQHIRSDFGVHAIIGLPLRSRERVIGVMLIVFPHSRRLMLEEKTFLMTLADYCAQALERAQLFEAERRARQQNQRLAERLARLQSLIIALSGAATSQDIFDIVLNLAVPALGAHAGLVMLLTEDRQYVEIVADTGYPQELTEVWRRFPANLKSTMIMMAIERHDLLLVHTPDELEALINRPRAESIHHAWATLPLIIDGVAIGGLGFSYSEPQDFDAADQQFMRTLAEQCSQAIYRIRLMEEQRAARQQAEQSAARIARLQLITSELAQALSPDEAADAVLHQGLQVVGATAGAVTLLSKDGQSLEVLQTQGYSTEIMASWRHIPLDSMVAPLAFAVRQNEAIWLRTPEERHALIGELPSDKYSPDHHAWASIPLFVNGKCIGALALSFREPQAFDPDQRGFALALADQCAQALERTRLQQVATEAAALEERQRLARDLHDSVSQVLYSATNTAEAIPRLLERNPARAREELDQLIVLNRAAMAEMRALLLELRPESIVRTPLKQLLEQLTRAIQGRKTIRIDFTFDSDPELRLPPEAHITFYRIAQEAVNNVVKHSGADYLEILFEETPRSFQMHISDNGQGFDLKRTSIGMGMATMRERAVEIGGDLHLHSVPGEGTQVVVEWAKR